MKREFGLIGYPLTYSFSQVYFNEKFQSEGIEAVYENFPLKRIEEFPSLIQSRPALAGLNVTIPYKQSVIPFLDEQPLPTTPPAPKTPAANQRPRKAT
jgi:shikimate dehydrogenase